MIPNNHLKKVFIASGITSSLFSSLIPFLRYSAKEVYGVVRDTEDAEKRKHLDYLRYQGCNLVQISNGNSLSKTIENFFKILNMTKSEIDNWRILWFSTHDDRETLDVCARIAPTLAIGSGAMIDFYLGSVPKSNDYIDSKLRMALTPNVTTLCCGFFLEDDPNIPPSPSGLHRDTTLILTKCTNGIIADPKWWSKGYYLTPKTFVCEAIVRWIADSHNKIGKWYHVGSIRTYSRAEIAKLLLGKLPTYINDVDLSVPNDNNVYVNYAEIFAKDFGIHCDHANILQSLCGLKEWAKRYGK
jgi:hypothetical protein